ncbi:MAG: efflux RND transporter periplasmic adaptor subunit [Saprospiraceae bacterium]|nr:efflux RND transporter periplasmic adaptor subunit [Saprospiraceae bacterium]MCB9324688.1 efflux RND transporter periplasmic adaptor subunit [Lewinellaceae bacterium]
MAKRKNTLIYGLVGVIVLLAALAAWKNNSKPKGEKVIVEKVEKRTIQEIVAASGKVFPQTEVKISSDVSGEVVELYIAEGDSVVFGQLLAKIDPDAYQSQVERGTANVNSAKAQLSNAIAGIETFKAQKEQITAQLNNARTIHKRNEDLKKEGVISQADYDASLATLRGLEANLRAAESNINSGEESANAARYSVESSQAMLRELQTSLKRTTIFAPVSGIVSSLNVEQGERVVGTIQMQGTEMMRIANLNAMEVRVDVSENDIPSVVLGNEAEIEVDAYLGRTFKGHVTQIAHSAANSATASLTSDQVTNFEVRISIDPESYKDIVTKDKPYPFRPGMSATVEIKTKSVEDVLSIPIQAVTTREKDAQKSKAPKKEGEEETKDEKDLLEVVFIVTEADTVKMMEVTTGIQDDDYIQILTGLKDEEEVVTGPYTAISRKLKQGDKIIKTSEADFYKSTKKE